MLLNQLTAMVYFPILLLEAALGAHAANPAYCPLLGPIYPAPASLSTSQYFLSATRDITSYLDAFAEAGNLTDSISLQIFTGTDETSLFKYSYTTPAIRNATEGVQKVDENTVFRIGSGTKLWTALMLMIKTHGRNWDDPIAKYVPRLRAAVKDAKDNATELADQIDYVQWEDVTFGELASHSAGIIRDYGFFDMASDPPLLKELEMEGFPVLKISQIPPCGSVVSCNEKEFFNGLLKAHPTAPTSSTPIYSNAGYNLLGIAIEHMTGMKYQQVLQEYLIQPLGLNHSSYGKPEDTLGVIPGTWENNYWNKSAGIETPAGGLYSSAKDMAAVGRAILNSTLLPAPVTRQWMKPVINTGLLTASVGRPWEIASYESDRRIDLYAKTGDLGLYSSNMVLSPDHNAGFTILAAGEGTTATVAMISDLIVDKLIPALESSAKAEARQKYAGTYSVGKNGSTITLITDNGPGLKISQWKYNSLDIISAIATDEGADASSMDIRLYPTGLDSPGKIGFRAIIQALSPVGPGLFSGGCITWATTDALTYGNIALSEFVFGVSPDGDVTSVSPLGLRQTIPKQQ